MLKKLRTGAARFRAHAVRPPKKLACVSLIGAPTSHYTASPHQIRTTRGPAPAPSIVGELEESEARPLNDDPFVNRRRGLSLSKHVAHEPFAPTRLPGSTKPQRITAKRLTTSLGRSAQSSKNATHAPFINTATAQDVERRDGHHQRRPVVRDD